MRKALKRWQELAKSGTLCMACSKVMSKTCECGIAEAYYEGEKVLEHMDNLRYRSILKEVVRLFEKPNSVDSRLMLLDVVRDILKDQDTQSKMREVLEKVLVVFGQPSSPKAKTVLLRVIRSILRDGFR